MFSGIFKKHLQLTTVFLYNSEKASGVSGMEKKYSHVDFMKIVRRNSSTVHAEKLLNDIYMDMFLNRIHREQTRKRIICLIDEALDQRDKEKFKLYAEQLSEFEEVL